MALWGASDADESKPKWLTTAQKKEVFANTSGWVVEAGSTMTGNGNANAQPEVLCCIGNLSTLLAGADLTEVEWITTTADKSAGILMQVRVRWNEAVTVTGTPRLTVTNDTNANHVLSYLSGSGSNELVFSLTISGGDSATDADDVLSIAGQTIDLNSGTIKDTSGTADDALLVISGAQGTAAGTITVVA